LLFNERGRCGGVFLQMKVKLNKNCIVELRNIMKCNPNRHSEPLTKLFTLENESVTSVM
jgi:hypothetical protein